MLSLANNLFVCKINSFLSATNKIKGKTLMKLKYVFLLLEAWVLNNRQSLLRINLGRANTAKKIFYSSKNKLYYTKKYPQKNAKKHQKITKIRLFTTRLMKIAFCHWNSQKLSCLKRIFN